ncbi:Yip1 family protein [Paenibacillus paeoniae]|uniref:YIP1 family protein n=1 Tax=Paenibacillus paeoniae TaxID=2292705 RepID=A0A371PGY5_9BACL|nr:Yip1 family protein [Paenibacillus paeoniae]REK75227.1 YIP1 family protein [Paenibacillus paeoniae]
MSMELLKQSFYVIFHPFNGFWELKNENKGRLTLALSLLFLLAISNILNRQLAGFHVNFNRLSDLNSIEELQFVILPFVLWCVANWSLTTLMDGEGKFRDIVIATGYSLLPFILIYIPLTIISNFITLKEATFYYLMQNIAFIWFIFLLFVGTMNAHQYTAGKTVVTMLLTLVVMGIIVFLGLLFFSLVQQITNFITTIYYELIFRV